MSYAVSDSVKCLEGVDYEVVKHNVHFEWVTGFETTIKELSAAVFDVLGVKDGKALDIVVKGLDGFQENLKNKMDALVEQVANKPDVNDLAKSFAVEWADACKYQISLKYHHAGDGPSAQKIRWGFESAIKYIVICATSLADKGEVDEFKKEVSDYVRDVIVQSIIDSLRTVKNELESLEKIS